MSAAAKKISGKVDTKMFDDVPVLQRKWQAALRPGDTLPRLWSSVKSRACGQRRRGTYRAAIHRAVPGEEVGGADHQPEEARAKDWAQRGPADM